MTSAAEVAYSSMSVKQYEQVAGKLTIGTAWWAGVIASGGGGGLHGRGGPSCLSGNRRLGGQAPGRAQWVPVGQLRRGGPPGGLLC